MHGREKVISNKNLETLGTKPIQKYRYTPGVATLGGKMYVLGGEEGWDRYHDTIGRTLFQSQTPEHERCLEMTFQSFIALNS